VTGNPKYTTLNRLRAFQDGQCAYLSIHNKGWRRAKDTTAWQRAVVAMPEVYGPVLGGEWMIEAIAYVKREMLGGQSAETAMRAACEKYKFTRGGFARAVLRMKGAKNG
jgi:hypothetical protein